MIAFTKHKRFGRPVAGNRNRRGFGVSAVLYLLGLIGVAGGLMFSNYMECFVQMMQMENVLTVRNDLMAASWTLVAQSVSGENSVLCTPTFGSSGG